MSKFYGQVEGQSSTCGTRRGNKYIKCSAQSYDGSVITELSYNENEELVVEIGVSDKSSFSVDKRLFKGTMKELITKLRA